MDILEILDKLVELYEKANAVVNANYVGMTGLGLAEPEEIEILEQADLVRSQASDAGHAAEKALKFEQPDYPAAYTEVLAGIQTVVGKLNRWKAGLRAVRNLVTGSTGAEHVAFRGAAQNALDCLVHHDRGVDLEAEKARLQTRERAMSRQGTRLAQIQEAAWAANSQARAKARNDAADAVRNLPQNKALLHKADVVGVLILQRKRARVGALAEQIAPLLQALVDQGQAEAGAEKPIGQPDS